MSNRPEDLLHLAELMAAASVAPDSFDRAEREMAARTVANRAYYSVYHAALELALANGY
ncbi:hypothetical protein BH11ARM2_BH11ARM2_21960 [soil metagenome]